jgi:hypothetical protein
MHFTTLATLCLFNAGALAWELTLYTDPACSITSLGRSQNLTGTDQSCHDLNAGVPTGLDCVEFQADGSHSDCASALAPESMNLFSDGPAACAFFFQAGCQGKGTDAHPGYGGCYDHGVQHTFHADMPVSFQCTVCGSFFFGFSLESKRKG